MFNLSIEKQALQQIQKVLAMKSAEDFFRIEVTSGGCAGFSTSFRIDNTIHHDDLVITFANIKVVINKTIADFLVDAELVYRSNIISSHFYLQVKTAKTTCSCGSSFSM